MKVKNEFKTGFNNMPYPIFDRISIESNSYCNRNCSFCTRSFDNRAKTKMPLDLIKKVLNELHQINYQGLIAFHFYNEIFTDDRIFTLFETCKELGLRNYITSNGDYLNFEKVKELSTYNIEEMNISLYNWKNDSDFVNLRNKTIERLGLDMYNWKFKIIRGGSHYGNRAGNAKHKIESLNLPLKAGCSRIDNKLEIRYDGVAVMCCQDYFGKHPIGNIRKNHILDIWYSKERMYQVSQLSKGLRENFELCSKCSDFTKSIE